MFNLNWSGKSLNDVMPRVLLLAVKRPSDHHFDERLSETIALVEAWDAQVEHTMIQAMDEKMVSTYVKSGKLEEVIQTLQAMDINYVLTLDELSPSQHRNLEEALSATVIDRTQLILMIFERRASTNEAKLQVQAATLSYLLPRMALHHGSVGRQQGGSAKTKGSGEKALALKKRVTEKQLHKVNQALKDLEIVHETQSAQRQKQAVFTVALVGYTNAGKSSLLNALTALLNREEGKPVSAKNRLFETLSTATRRVRLNGQDIILTDTVGFVSNLPHTLIKAFRSTLNEVVHADCLIHVIDGSSLELERQQEVTLETLDELGCKDKPMITVYNKGDLMSHEGLSISALTGLNLDALVHEIDLQRQRYNPSTVLLIPYEDHEVLVALKKMYPSLTIQEREQGYHITIPYRVELPDAYKPYQQ